VGGEGAGDAGAADDGDGLEAAAAEARRALAAAAGLTNCGIEGAGSAGVHFVNALGRRGVFVDETHRIGAKRQREVGAVDPVDEMHGGGAFLPNPAPHTSLGEKRTV
jgi:hypothetical protein